MCPENIFLLCNILGLSSIVLTINSSLTNCFLSIYQAPGGSVRLTDQVIEEVDEQATITSMRRPDPRPTVMDIFAKDENMNKEDKSGADEALLGAPPASAPVNVPRTSYGAHIHSSYRPVTALSSSAPLQGGHISVASPSRFSDNFPEVHSFFLNLLITN